MVAGIAHEINNPLSFVLNNLHIIKTDFTEIGDVLHKYQAGVGSPAEIQCFKNDIQISQGLEELTDVIQTSYDGIKRIQEIILNMRNFTRLDNKRSYVNLYEGIESALMILHHKLKNRITVEKKFHPIPETYCVCGQLIQVFMNLLNNAADAIIDQGVITIKGFEQNQQIILLFTDTGSGIPSENIDRLFEPFFTTKDKGHGLGLGLSIVHSIITNHKGTITVDSGPKKTTFRIALPVDSGAGSG
ncbi:MAG: histidine kinase [Candidatus Magnetoglobus multicellularis str. Araruama]|uniref:histidine kinase n=1 Tax=Candidatus Magnetoglobus multicellularis str. Araruama TaxID=890399 RepID=A0A1V1NXG1_9BACT|nr:MAG: histidine kinase [Candidatus Magnetoglobus multicellularis str. Araruama]